MSAQAPPQGPPQGMPQGPPQPGQQPTPEQIQAMQRQIAAEAEKAGMSVPDYINKLKQQAMAQHQAQQRAQQQQQQGGQQQAIQPGPPKPEALAVANFLKSQDLKLRTVIHDEKRKDMFRVKRAIRVLQSPAYQKARSKKGSLLPEVNDRASAENTFKLLPLSLLALRVTKIDATAHEGHNHGKAKRVKGQWTVKIEQHQEANDDCYYIWLFEGSQWKMKLYAGGAVVAIMAVVLFPLWPLFMRQGVWYLSMAMLGLIGLFFTMAIFRLILFIITMFAAPPGFWLYPNLFEDVGFFDSFRPAYAWQETPDDIKAKKTAKKDKKAAKAAAKAGLNGKPSKGKKGAISPAPEEASSPVSEAEPAPQPTGLDATAPSGTLSQRPPRATVEEAESEEEE